MPSDGLQVKDGSQIQLPIPPDDLIYLVVGARNIDSQFLATGEQDVKTIKALLGATGSEIKAGSRILDWGCGCGRLARHWLSDTNVEFYGCDINPLLASWCTQNLPFGYFTTSDLKPPLPYPAVHFDVIYATSVLTHLLFDTQYLWMEELWRVLKPGGVAVLTTVGPSMFKSITDQVVGGLTSKSRLIDDGLFVDLERQEGANETLNMVTRDVMSKFFYAFELLDYRPHFGLMGIQDVYILRKKTNAELKLVPSLLNCEMNGHVFTTEITKIAPGVQQCTFLASARNLLIPANIQLSIHFPDRPSVKSSWLRLPEKVSWTALEEAYVFISFDDLPKYTEPATVAVQVASARELDGVHLRLDNCTFLTA